MAIDLEEIEVNEDQAWTSSMKNDEWMIFKKNSNSLLQLVHRYDWRKVLNQENASETIYSHDYNLKIANVLVVYSNANLSTAGSCRSKNFIDCLHTWFDCWTVEPLSTERQMFNIEQKENFSYLQRFQFDFLQII